MFLRLDLDQFSQRILETPADRDGAANLIIKVGEFFATHGADRVNTRSRLVDDHVSEQGKLLVGRVRLRGRRWAFRLGWTGRMILLVL